MLPATDKGSNYAIASIYSNVTWTEVLIDGKGRVLAVCVSRVSIINSFIYFISMYLNEHIYYIQLLTELHHNYFAVLIVYYIMIDAF